MKLQSLIASLERKVNSVHVPIRPKPSYVIPESTCKKSLGEPQTLTTLEEKSNSRSAGATPISNEIDEHPSKENDPESDEELKSLSIASQIFTSCDSESEIDSPISLSHSKQNPLNKSKEIAHRVQELSKELEHSDDSDFLSDSDLNVLARHKNWERGLSQRTNTFSEPSQSQRSVGKAREVTSSQHRSRDPPKRSFLHDELRESDNTEIEGSAPKSIEPAEEDYAPLSEQTECQRYLQNRKRTWEIRSLNPEHSQHIMTSSYVLQELEKSTGHNHPSVARSRKRYTSFGSSCPSMSQGAQHSSVPMDENKLRLFSESLAPSNVAEALGPVTEQVRRRPNPLERATIDPRKLNKTPSVARGDVNSSHKLEFPRNFQAE